MENDLLSAINQKKNLCPTPEYLQSLPKVITVIPIWTDDRRNIIMTIRPNRDAINNLKTAIRPNRDDENNFTTAIRLSWDDTNNVTTTIRPNGDEEITLQRPSVQVGMVISRYNPDLDGLKTPKSRAAEGRIFFWH